MVVAGFCPGGQKPDSAALQPEFFIFYGATWLLMIFMGAKNSLTLPVRVIF
jgi:hypothetical protein